MNRPALALIAAGAALRVPFLFGKSLWMDEAMTLAIARAPWRELVPLVRENELLPPLHYLLMGLWTRLLPEPLIALRSFSFLCGVASLAVFHRLARRLLPEREALLALAVACAASYWIDTAQSARPYAFLLLLSALSLDLMLALRERWRGPTAALYWIVGLLGLYTHYYFGFWLLAQYFLLASERRPMGRWLGAGLLWAALFAPWVPSLLAQLRVYDGKPTLTEPFGLARLLELLGGFFLNLSVLGMLAPGWIKAAGAGALALLAWTRSRPELVLLAAPLLAAKSFELALGRPMTEPRYFVFLSLPAYLLAGRALARLPKLAGPALALTLLAGLGGYYLSAAKLDSGLASLAEALRRQSRPGDAVVHLSGFYYAPLRYYYLPELRHYLLDTRSTMLNWKALPGEPVFPPADLRERPRLLVVDPERRLFPGRIGVAPGRAL